MQNKNKAIKRSDGMLEKFFKLEKHGTNVKTEVTAGITTFMTMAYILVIQPMFMSAAGMDVGAVTVVTAVLGAVFSIFMGLYINLPFALAPAMGSNAFFAYTLVAGGIVDWQTDLRMVFISGIAFKLNIMGALKWSFFSLMFTFFVGDFFSTLGTLLGVSAKADLLDENGNLPNINKPFLVDAIATVVGALFGSTVVTTYIESAAGVEEGGRTGLTAVIARICFALTIFLTPIAGMIPSEATAPALILIGLLMISGIKNIEFDEFTEAFPAFATIVFTTFTSSISNGISIGILSYMFTKVLAGKYKELNWGIYILAIPLLMYFVI